MNENNAESAALVTIAQLDENKLGVIKSTFRFYFVDRCEVLRFSVGRIYDHIYTNKNKFDFTKNFLCIVTNPDTKDLLMSCDLNLDFLGD